MNLKAQADIVSIIMIVVVSLGLVSTALMWGLPLIEKRQDTVLVERVDKAFDMNNMNSLPRKIEAVAKNGGEAVFTLDINGKWYLDTSQTGENNNSIRFTFVSRAYKVAQDVGWVSLSTGNPNPTGTLGIDDPAVVFSRTDKVSDKLNITYKVWFRELYGGGKSYKVFLFAESSGTSTGRSIKISRIGEPKQDPKNATLIKTEINILFE